MLILRSIGITLLYYASVNGTTTCQKYAVEKGVQASLSVQSLGIVQPVSLVWCAAMCNQHVRCCSASYGDDFSCTLHSCCFPETVTVANGKHMRKQSDKDDIGNPKDCSELPPGSDNGVYTIYPTVTLQVDVFCDMRSECGIGWTVVQRRIDGTINFNVNWAAYKAGFGDLTTEFWIGNNVLNIMTTSKRYILRFDMEAPNGDTAYAEYDVFVVGEESTQYTLSIGGYSGTAGDAMAGSNSLDGMKFSTFDRDNDISGGSCSDNRKGGWWWRACGFSNPNGSYNTTENFIGNVYWREFRDYTALMSMSMKIKPY